MRNVNITSLKKFCKQFFWIVSFTITFFNNSKKNVSPIMGIHLDKLSKKIDSEVIQKIGFFFHTF